MTSHSKLPAVRGSGRARPTSMFDVPSEYMKRLQNIGDSDGRRTPESGSTSTKLKRMSLLPQFSRKASGEKETAAQEDVSESDAASFAERRSLDKQSMPPPPRPRPTSMRPPSQTAAGRSAGEHARTPSNEGGHSRHVSKESVHAGTPSRATHGGVPTRTSSQRTLNPPSASSGSASTGLKRAGSTRLPQSPAVTGARTSSQQTSGIRGPAISSNTPSSTVAAKRRSVSKPSQASTTTKTPSPARPTSSRPQLVAPPKPAFTTYQQHYSPAKSTLPKPGLPAPKSTRPPTSSEAPEEAETITADTALEQIELLQLSLLHQASAQTSRAYELSARQRLHKYHAKLCKEYDAIHSQELESRCTANLTALETWCPEPTLLSEHLQTLNRIVSEVRSQTVKDSRYSEVVESFELWATEAEQSLLGPDERENGENLHFIEPLPESWRGMHTSLALKFRAIQREIEMLPPLPSRSNSAMEPSSLEVMVRNCEVLVGGVLRELEVMMKVQKEVLARGKARIDDRVREVVAEVGREDGDKENWVPAWGRV